MITNQSTIITTFNACTCMYKTQLDMRFNNIQLFAKACDFISVRGAKLASYSVLKLFHDVGSGTLDFLFKHYLCM